MVDWKDATIHVASHVIHYGTGAFEGREAALAPAGDNLFAYDGGTPPSSDLDGLWVAGFATNNFVAPGAQTAQPRNLLDQYGASLIRGRRFANGRRRAPDRAGEFRLGGGADRSARARGHGMPLALYKLAGPRLRRAFHVDLGHSVGHCLSPAFVKQQNHNS